MSKIDASQPIEVVHEITGEIFLAEFVRFQANVEGRYEIIFRGKKWAVGSNNLVTGGTDESGPIAPDYKVRNCEKKNQ